MANKVASNEWIRTGNEQTKSFRSQEPSD